MESTSSPDNGRQSRGLGRFWPVQGSPAPGQRLPSPPSGSGSSSDSADADDSVPESSPALDAPTGEHPQVGDGQPAVPGVHQLGLSSEMQMVPLGSRRAPEVVGGGGPRLVGKFPPDLEPGPRHGAVVPLPTGHPPLAGVPLPGSRSPFGPIASASNGTGPDPESPKRSALGSGAPFGSALGSPLAPAGGTARPSSGAPSSEGSSDSSPGPSSPPPSSSGPSSSGPSSPAPSSSGPSSPAPSSSGPSSPAPSLSAPATLRGAAAVPVAGQRSGDDQPRTTEGQGGESSDGPRNPVGARTAAGWATLPTSGMPATGAAGPGSRITEALRPDSARPGESPRPGDPVSPRPGDDSVAPLPPPRRSTTLGDAEEPRSRVGRRAAPEPDEESGDAAATTDAKADGPKRPGDIDETAIAFWEGKAIERFRGEWYEVKADFVDDPVAALTRAHELITEAVNKLTGSLLAERDELDPLRTTSTPDTESMRMAMRGYREFLDRILAL